MLGRVQGSGNGNERLLPPSSSEGGPGRAAKGSKQPRLGVCCRCQQQLSAARRWSDPMLFELRGEDSPSDPCCILPSPQDGRTAADWNWIAVDHAWRQSVESDVCHNGQWRPPPFRAMQSKMNPATCVPQGSLA